MNTSNGEFFEGTRKKSKVSSGCRPQRRSFWQARVSSALRLRIAYSAIKGSADGTQLLGEYSLLRTYSKPIRMNFPRPNFQIQLVHLRIAAKFKALVPEKL